MILFMRAFLLISSFALIISPSLCTLFDNIPYLKTLLPFAETNLLNFLYHRQKQLKHNC